MDRKVAERMTDHVEDLALLNGITLHWSKKSWRQAHAYPRARTVTVPVIRQPSDYLVALHEIGHIAHPLAMGMLEEAGRLATVTVEGAAWAWASEHAKPSLVRFLRKDDWARVGYAFTTHMRR